MGRLFERDGVTRFPEDMTVRATYWAAAEIEREVQEAADYITTLEAKLAVAREALEPVRDFLIYEVGFEDDDEPLTAILRALKEIEQ